MACAILSSLAIVAYVGWRQARALFVAHTHISVQRIAQIPGAPERVALVRAHSDSLLQALPPPPKAPPSSGDATSPGFYDPAGSPRSISSDAIVAALQRDASVNDQERVGIERVFSIAQAIQKGIDTEPSDETRSQFQRQLIEQIELRLKMILKDERRLEVAREPLRGLPRIEVTRHEGSSNQVGHT
jgi:hypothetical protein